MDTDKSQKIIKDLGGTQDAGNSNWRTLLARLVKYLNAKQVIEMGAEDGYSTAMMLHEMPEDARIYSIDINPKWAAVGEDPRLIKIVGDDCDMAIWEPYDINLHETDFWIIDSDHSYEHISLQWERYSPYFKKGAVVAIDDLDSLQFPGVTQFWNELKSDKFQVNLAGIVVI